MAGLVTTDVNVWAREKVPHSNIDRPNALKVVGAVRS